MAYVGVFRTDPPPPQVSPHAPIPGQGQQPSPGGWPNAATLGVIARSWVPPDPPPQQRLTTAPIPTQGGRPAFVQQRVPFPPTPDPLPQLSVQVAPLIPPSVFTPFVSVQPWAALLAWVAANYPVQDYPVVPAQVQGQQPPPSSTVVLNETVVAWRSPDPAPFQRETTAPIPAQGQQPPPVTTRVVTWTIPDPPPTLPEQIAAVVPLSAFVPSAVTQPLAIVSWVTPTYPVQEYPTVPVPAQGQQPPPTSVRTYSPPVTDPLPVRPVQVAPLIPPSVFVPFFPVQPYAILQTWTVSDPVPRNYPTVPIPVQGQQPPPTAVKVPAAVMPDPPLPFRPAQVAPLIPPTTFVPLSPVPTSVALGAWFLPTPPTVQDYPTVPIPVQGQQPPAYSLAGLYALFAAWTLLPDPAPTQQPRFGTTGTVIVSAPVIYSSLDYPFILYSAVDLPFVRSSRLNFWA